ncbi:MAG: FkbM family methyltransferase [Archangium sp.]
MAGGTGRCPTSPLLMRVMHESGVVRVRQTRQGAMAYPTTDAHVGRSLDLYGQWAQAELELCGLFLKPGSIAIDVGANLGTHAVSFAQRVGPTGAVIAFEPQRLMHQLLCTNATLNGVSWLRAVHGAVGAEAGAITVPDVDYSSSGNFGGLSLAAPANGGDTVPLFALDTLGLPRCALIKIDVEGMEGQVLDGARALIASTRPAIYFEHNAPNGAPDVIERLLRHEYACFWHFSPFFDAKNFAGETKDVFGGLLDANVLAVPRAMAGGLETVLRPVLSPQDTAHQALAR